MKNLLSGEQCRTLVELAVRHLCCLPPIDVQAINVERLSLLGGLHKQRVLAIRANGHPKDRQVGLEDDVAIASIRVQGGNVTIEIQHQEAARFQPATRHVSVSINSLRNGDAFGSDDITYKPVSGWLWMATSCLASLVTASDWPL